MADQAERHPEHDLLLIASLLDRDADPAERSAAETLIASCSECAALHADLVMLTNATSTLAMPPRPRAFTLTPADAERLAAPAPGEPGIAAPRLAGVMTDLHGPAHAAHDTILVASLVDHSLASSERAAAEALVASCTDCAALNADLLALQVATQSMPTPTRPRDFSLTPDDATRLRSGGWWRFVAMLGSPRDALSRPLAVGLTTLGIAGLLVANAPSLSFGMGSSSGAPILSTVGAAVGESGSGSDTAGSVDGAAQPAASAAAAAPPGGSAAPIVPAPDGGVPVYGAIASPATLPVDRSGSGTMTDGVSPAPGSEAVTNGSTKGTSGGSTGRGGEPGATTGTLSSQTGTGVSMVVVLSAAFLITGLGLFALRWTARRLRSH